MTAPSERSLLRDIAKLLAKHPREEWERLIAALNDDGRRQQVIEAIKALLTAAPPTRAPDGGRREGAGLRLEELGRTEPEKAELLKSLRLKLHERHVLPTAQSLREFAAIAGLKQTVSSRREQAINEIINHLSGLSVPELNQILRQRVRGDRDLGAEYERWVELILGRKDLGRPG